MTVRSRSLAIGNMTGGTIQPYSVPSGARTILKYVTAHHSGNVSNFRLNIRVSGVVTATPLRFSLVSNVVSALEVWIVLMEGWEIQLVSDAGTPANVTYTLSGTELALL